MGTEVNGEIALTLYQLNNSVIWKMSESDPKSDASANFATFAAL